jgi:hypothetical protein
VFRQANNAWSSAVTEAIKAMVQLWCNAGSSGRVALRA